MNREFQIRFIAGFLVLMTVGAATLAWINFRKEGRYVPPSDGVWWVEHGGSVIADRVDPDGPGAKAGIRRGDRLLAIDGRRTPTTVSFNEQLYREGAWSKPVYNLLRGSIELEASPILVPAARTSNGWLRFIALIYLGIGLYVLFRRWTAPGSTHFYIFCLVSFIFYAFKYTGKLNAFDWTIYWGNVAAWMLQPALFLHFALTFPEEHSLVRRRRSTLLAVYLPGLLLLGFHVLSKLLSRASEMLRWQIDRLEMGYLVLYFVVAAIVLLHSYHTAARPILRQQLKWVTRGTILAITPFTLFYAVPFLLGALPTSFMKASVLSLGVLPLTFGYAIFRYRLMDVDLIFKRGMAYTLAAATIAGAYFTAVALVGEFVHTRVPSAGTTGLVLAIVVTALLFDPVRRWIQGRIERLFYRRRHDYRETLVEFGRELNAETDLDKMLTAVIDQLSRTLLVDRMAIFLVAERETFVLAKSFGIQQTGNLDLDFLAAPRPETKENHLFFENTHHVPRESASAQDTIARLDLNYYIPCRAQKSTVAVLGLGKTVEGDFLSSEDVGLLETVAGYLAIAVQNARLYASLEQKIAQYERLKDFNENIVESINVGVLAVDLEDRVESWNSQMEVTYALPRWQVLGRSLREIFPDDFTSEFYRLRQSPGIHNLYKFRLAAPTGETRTVNVAIAPLVTRNFTVVGRLIIIDDITERVELESQLSQADKLSSIGLLAAGVAHEVNTPLAVISSYAQLLSKQLHGDEQKSGLLDKITRQTFRASEIVNNLLNFSRTSATEFTEIDLNRIILDTLNLLEHQFKTTRIQVHDELFPHLPSIQGNAGRLQQVFLNLFLNAKDAMPGGGILRVSTSNGDAVSVTIADSGTGIAHEHIQRIYDPFFTTKLSPQDGQRRGTGLGLAVTYGIIQEHAGKIRVESVPNEGTTFYLEFPMLRKTVHV
ncbi:MAG: PAS domain S-box protein [Acidobacteria bacterium]|nr:PAS domain S-box protein [Acidobacteriota bacterium]